MAVLFANNNYRTLKHDTIKLPDHKHYAFYNFIFNFLMKFRQLQIDVTTLSSMSTTSR